MSDLEQNALALCLLDEIESHRIWNSFFAESEDVLGQMALDALAEKSMVKNLTEVSNII